MIPKLYPLNFQETADCVIFMKNWSIWWNFLNAVKTFFTHFKILQEIWTGATTPSKKWSRAKYWTYSVVKLKGKPRVFPCCSIILSLSHLRKRSESWEMPKCRRISISFSELSPFRNRQLFFPTQQSQRKKILINMSSSEFEKKCYIAHNHGKVHVSSVKMI